jgi:formylglycine-generating enzyme required for sulfatase activity
MLKILRMTVATVLLCVCTIFNSCNTISDREFEVNGVKFKMIAVEGGSFMMGATPGQGDDARENEKPAHKVTVDDFLIGETEVTQELWFAVMGNNPSHFKKEGNYPVENVSWNDVLWFIKELNEITGQHFRLPYESEWEYAARGGKKSTDKKYSGSDDVDEVAWYAKNANKSTHAVASKKANELGLYDMSGNVFEMVQDSNLVNPPKKYTVKGGAITNPAKAYPRVSSRYSFETDFKAHSIGFRLVI